MKKFFMKLEPVDIIAIITIIGGLYLKLAGADGVVGSLLMAIVFYYFGKKGLSIMSKPENPQNDEKS